MKKIGILTINDYDNYGNRYQNYACQEVLKSLGYSVETIVNTTDISKRICKNSKNKKVIEFLNLSNREIFELIEYKIWYLLNRRKILFAEDNRKKEFKQFTSQNIIESNFSIELDAIPESLRNNYDYFLAGSDQVWNPHIKQGSEIYFLTFAPPNKRIAYAPSFGVSEIPIEHIGNFKKWLMEMNKISVREDVGANIIEKLIGKTVPVLLDPTFMLTKKDWIDISIESKIKPKNDYLLMFYLGKVPDDYLNQILIISKKYNLDIINIGNIKDLKTYDTGPGQFIDLIKSASVICTDSYHGGAFSIIFEKPFIIFPRQNSKFSMNSRLETLLKKFRFENRINSEIKSSEDVFNIDFQHVSRIIDKEKKKTYEFLKDSLGIKG